VGSSNPPTRCGRRAAAGGRQKLCVCALTPPFGHPSFITQMIDPKAWAEGPDQGAARGHNFLADVLGALTRLSPASRALAGQQVQPRFVRAALGQVKDPTGDPTGRRWTRVAASLPSLDAAALDATTLDAAALDAAALPVSEMAVAFLRLLARAPRSQRAAAGRPGLATTAGRRGARFRPPERRAAAGGSVGVAARQSPVASSRCGDAGAAHTGPVFRSHLEFFAIS